MSEHDEQCAFIQWVDLNLMKHPAYLLIHANANGGHRHKTVASKLKNEGVRAGVWDVYCLWPSGGYHGLMIEFKHGKNKLTDQQRVWRVRYSEAGYATTVCYDWQSAVDDLTEYLNLEKSNGEIQKEACCD